MGIYVWKKQKDGHCGWTKDVGRGQLSAVWQKNKNKKSVHCQQLAPGQDHSTKIIKKKIKKNKNQAV